MLRLGLASFCLVLAPLAAQQGTPDQLVVKWIAGSVDSRVALRRQIVDLGSAVVAPLAARLGDADAATACEVLAILVDLGAAAGKAMPTIADRLETETSAGRTRDTQQASLRLALITALAELVPHDEDEAERDTRVSMFMIRTRPEDETTAYQEARYQGRRLVKVPVDANGWIEALAARSPLLLEIAIERLHALGPAAARAVPRLHALFSREEPMQLPFEHRVPLHRKAARALLAIAPGSPEAETARAVLAGTWQVSAVATPVVPVRMRQRIDALLAELTDATADELRRRSAVDNLVALGAPAAVPVAMLLEPGCPAGVIQAALEVLTRLGKHAAPAVRRLTKVLFELPCDHTVAVMRALTATVPWSDDVFLPLNYLSSGDSLEIVGRKIQGTCDAAFLNAFREASDDFHIMGRVALDSSIDSLRELLTGRDPRMRRRALEVVVARAGDCVGLLDTLAPMMAEDQPKEPFSEWQPNGSVRTGMRDCSDRIHRLAANAILAVAPSNHPLLAKARERLAEQKR